MSKNQLRVLQSVLLTASFLCHSEEIQLPKEPLTRLTCYSGANDQSSEELDVTNQNGIQVIRIGVPTDYSYEVILPDGRVYLCSSVVTATK